LLLVLAQMKLNHGSNKQGPLLRPLFIQLY
jgi:hypothetical protein